MDRTELQRLVALLYVMPQLCQGSTEVRTAFDLMPFMSLLELATGPIIELTQMRMLNRVFADFTVESDGSRYQANRTAELLDEGAFDPERISLLDMVQHGVTGTLPDSCGLDPRRLLSKA